MINIYDSKTIDFNNNGVVVLSDTKSCLTTEELNGTYEVVLEHPMDEYKKWQSLLEGNIVKTNGQLFRIYHKTKTLTSLKINARHIFYDLIDNFLEDCRPTNISGQGALNWILTHTQYEHNFISMGDIGGSNTKYFVRKNPVEAIMGTDGIVSNWGGELVRDNFTIKLLASRGLDRGVLISYGKNIQGIEETLDMDSLCTKLMPVGKDGLLLTEKYVDSPYINNFHHPIIKTQDFNDCEDEETLRVTATKYMLDNKIDIPPFNYKIDFLELSKTEEYKNYSMLESVYLGDTVTIKHSKLNINLKAKVIKITTNNLTNKIEKIELGSFKPNLSVITKNIRNMKNEITQVKSDYQIAIDNATQLITGAKGGNVVIRLDANKKPYEILIMDTQDVNTAMKVWRWNIGGLGYSSTGINGPYGVAMTSDGKIVADFITAGSLNAGIITAGILTSSDGSCSINLSTGEIHFDKGIIQGLNSSWDLDAGIFTSKEVINPSYSREISIGAGYISSQSRLELYSVDTMNLTVDSNAGGPWRGIAVQNDGWTYIHNAEVIQLNAPETIVFGNEVVKGDLLVEGSKNRIVDTSEGKVKLNAYETTECLFGDFGNNILDGNGTCEIDIDSLFAETICLDNGYEVFITKYGKGDIWVEDKEMSSFFVQGEPNLKFAWNIVAKQKGYENVRLDKFLGREATV